jgi:hypothetical protein
MTLGITRARVIGFGPSACRLGEPTAVRVTKGVQPMSAASGGRYRRSVRVGAAGSFLFRVEPEAPMIEAGEAGMSDHRRRGRKNRWTRSVGALTDRYGTGSLKSSS